MKYHVIWCPKYRRRVLVGPIERRWKDIIAGVVAEVDGVVIEVETMPDHVRLLVEVPPQLSPSWFISSVGGALLVIPRCGETQKVAAAGKRAG